MNTDLEKLGFDTWFRSRGDQRQSAAHGVARVVSVHKDSYKVTTGQEDIYAELSGNLLYSTGAAVELPTTGDWVYADCYDDDTHAIIYGVFPRKTLLKRKTAGKLVDYQLIGANIDGAFVMQSLNENFNLRRLERYLAMVHDAGIQPTILLSKTDLISREQVDDRMGSVLDVAPRTPVIEFSNLSRENVDTIVAALNPGSTYCLLGSSGVGKTTLLNTLIGSEEYETKPISKIQSKGRHTTTSRQLIRLESGAMIIDTPGMRELGSMAVDDGIEETFSEIEELSRNCRFGDCSHTDEKGCAVRAAIRTGDLSEQRYENYLKMRKESDFNRMSYLEKRKKDKSFGKMVKSVMKDKRR